MVDLLWVEVVSSCERKGVRDSVLVWKIDMRHLLHAAWVAKHHAPLPDVDSDADHEVLVQFATSHPEEVAAAGLAGPFCCGVPQICTCRHALVHKSEGHRCPCPYNRDEDCKSPEWRAIERVPVGELKEAQSSHGKVPRHGAGPHIVIKAGVVF